MQEDICVQETPVMVTPIKPYKMIATRGVVVFPGDTVSFEIIRDKSLAALQKASESGEDIFVVSQKHSSTVKPAPKDIYRVGTLVKILKIVKLPSEAIRVSVLGIKRMEIESYSQISPYFEVQLVDFSFPEDPIRLEAAKRVAFDEYELYKKSDGKIPSEIAASITPYEPERFLSAIAAFVFRKDSDKQNLLQMHTVADQLTFVSKYIAGEAEIIAVEKKIAASVRDSVAKGQKEFYLREQIRAIKKELGEDTEETYLAQAKQKKVPLYVEEKIKQEASRLEKMPSSSPDAAVVRTYIEWLLDVPWTEKTSDNLDLKKAREILDEDHFGLEKVKDRIIEYLAVHKLTGNLNGAILCFVGPPGVGKTSIVRSIARAAGKKFVSMSLGGVKDEAEIRGHRRTYIGALPGRIISSMKNAGVINPVFLFDEIDKMSSDFRGDPASAMLEVLDPSQNYKFCDHYIEIPYDLSSVMFVMTANTVDTIAPPLLDRMEIIELGGYTVAEKEEIAKRHLIKKQISVCGMEGKDITFTDDAIASIIGKYTRESGVRSLEREIGSIIRKLAVEEVNGELTYPVTIDSSDIEKYLGSAKFDKSKRETGSEVGKATGLAWTSAGGTTLSIEATLIPGGKGETVLTGSLGDVMKESCKVALSYLRANASKWGIDSNVFNKHDFHIHFPEGATPKDGPSAGITIATALLSALTDKKVDCDVAMTGEITLRGNVLAIGGLKEKTMAALTSGIKTVIIPRQNSSDVKQLPKEVIDGLNIICVDYADEVFEKAILKNDN